MVTGITTYYAERREAMRRARNAAFYAHATECDADHVHAEWKRCAVRLVADARSLNRLIVMRLREYRARR